MKYLIFFIIISVMIAGFLSIVYSEEMVLSGTLKGGVRVVEVKAFKYGFGPDPIVVKVNKKVRLEAISTDVTHGLRIKKLGINLVVPKGKIASIEFTPKEAGTFRIRCSVFCGFGHGGMRGVLVVVDK